MSGQASEATPWDAQTRLLSHLGARSAVISRLAHDAIPR